VELTQWTNGVRLSSLFSYDGFGRRVKNVEEQNGSVTSTKQFVWDGGQPCEERDINSSVTKRLSANREQIGGVNYYFTKDHLGSIREMIDNNGAIMAATIPTMFRTFTRLTSKSQGQVTNNQEITVEG
jgi:hypothetical protein